MIFNRNGKKASGGGVSGLGNCLIFSSLSDFTLKVYDGAKHWSGTLEWTDGQQDWAVWDGTTTLQSAGGFLALRGTGNSVITGSNQNYRWVLTGSNIRCDGNIETLLDYQSVANGTHPAMASYCYANMFYGCTALTTAPALPATMLSRSCYSAMFQNCTSLTTAPALPATTMADACYGNMFRGCTSLTSAPALPATKMAISCYTYMFQGCTSLTTAPALPATLLGDYCYYYMFQGCKALTSAPALPATSLLNYCYQSMFQGCTKIKLSTTQAGDYLYEYRIPTTGTGTARTDPLKNMFTSTGGTFTGTPTINTTYYTDHPPIAA